MPNTRRALLKAAGAASALAAAAAVQLPAQTSAPTPTPTPDKPPEGLARLARERYGKFLTPEELPLLDRDMAAVERRSARLRAIPLANAEEPAVDFEAVRR